MKLPTALMVPPGLCESVLSEPFKSWPWLAMIIGRLQFSKKLFWMNAEHAFAVALERAGHGLDPVTRTAFELALDERARSASD